MIEKPKPEALFAWGTQPRKLYEALATCGEVSNGQIVRDLRILAYGGVINKVRKALVPYGIDVAIRSYGHGVFTYRLAANKKYMEDLCPSLDLQNKELQSSKHHTDQNLLAL